MLCPPRLTGKELASLPSSLEPLAFKDWRYLIRYSVPLDITVSKAMIALPSGEVSVAGCHATEVFGGSLNGNVRFFTKYKK